MATQPARAVSTAYVCALLRALRHSELGVLPMDFVVVPFLLGKRVEQVLHHGHGPPGVPGLVAPHGPQPGAEL
ncbi:hypothetical protein JJV70_06795 [Streptomyces sp. JJ66]|uniref:hypothetical protein n=1 Tax=Streptomyces sp. JJ66 TaxID=2803843 RepID=UPI001C55D573|nr:hypothetical protein [Streptomyces sp. JJ66]MBW1601820.1 hypothetical protein [Streptomyces sp. JJ66]